MSAHRRRNRCGEKARWMSISLRHLMGIGLILGALAWAGAASAGATLYAVETFSCNCFFSIDLLTGIPTSIGPIAEDPTPFSMAVDLDGTIYVVDNSSGTLLAVDPGTGIGTAVSTGVGSIGGLAVAPVAIPGPSGTLPPGTILGTRIGNVTDQLVIVHKGASGDGAVTAIALLERNIAGLEFRGDGVLFGAQIPMGALVTIDTATGEETVIGNMSAPPAILVGALAMSPAGELLVSTGGNGAPNTIWKVDQTTAVLSDPLIVDDTMCCSLPQGLAFATPPIAVERVTWGRIKEIYRSGR